MEVIEHDGRVGQIASYRSDVRLRHVHGNGINTGSGRSEPFPEKFQSIGAFAFTDEDNRSAVQIEHDRQVSMPVTNADLIDGDSLKSLQRRTGKALLEISLPDLFDSMPTNSQMASHIPCGHVSGELQDVTLERPGVSPVRISKRDVHLSERSTAETTQSLHVPLDQRGTQTDRQSDPRAPDRPFLLHGSTPATGTLEHRWVLIDSENRPSPLESRMGMMNSPSHDAKTVIQYTRGHDFFAFSDLSQNQRTQEIMSSFPLQRWYAFTRRPFFVHYITLLIWIYPRYLGYHSSCWNFIPLLIAPLVGAAGKTIAC
jgi:hypothetical protein